MTNNLSPINRVAARVVFGKKEEYISNKKVTTNDNPMPIQAKPIPSENAKNKYFKNLTGIKFGRFEVIGLAMHFKKAWVVKCRCGMYSTRKRKAILNPENIQDRCERCRELSFMKREQRYKATGEYKSIREF